MDIYKIQIDEDAFQDIQFATDWYNEQLDGLGARFQKQVKIQINSLKKDAAIYSNRYADVHCLIINTFPFMVHYTVNEHLKLVEIFAIIHTSRNPKIWKKRRKK